MGRGKNYTDEEKSYIKENGGILETEDIAKYLNRSVSSVRTMAQRLSVPLRTDYYTEEEIAYITSHAGVEPWFEIARELGRSESALWGWSHRNGVSGSKSLPKQRSKFTEMRECGGLYCENAFAPRRGWQKYCSEKCAQTIYHLEKYNLTKERWWELFNAQGCVCVCGKSEALWHVDHDHSCCPYGSSCGGCVRGILCDACNHALGKVRDNPKILRRLAHYLEEALDDSSS